MAEVDEKIKEIRDQILRISAEKELQTFRSRFFSDTDLQLDIIARKIVEKKEPPVILFNLQPWNHFNVLHAVYCQKLKECIEMGFNCVVILYDKLIEKRIGVPHKEKPTIHEAVKRCTERFIRAGIKEEKTEFITESDIWSFIKFEEFAETITSFAHICDFDKNWAERNDIISLIMDNLCEIYYESVINCDVVLTSELDVQNIWKMIRSKISDKDLLPFYTPPLILYYPTLIGIDGCLLSTYSDDNSLSISHSTEELRSKLTNCPEDFLETLLDFLIIPWKEKIRDDGRQAYSFKELKEKSPDKIRNLAISYTEEYFSKILGHDL